MCRKRGRPKKRREDDEPPSFIVAAIDKFPDPEDRKDLLLHLAKKIVDFDLRRRGLPPAYFIRQRRENDMAPRIENVPVCPAARKKHETRGRTVVFGIDAEINRALSELAEKRGLNLAYLIESILWTSSGKPKLSWEPK